MSTPDDLVGALQNIVHKEYGGVRVARTLKGKTMSALKLNGYRVSFTYDGPGSFDKKQPCYAESEMAAAFAHYRAFCQEAQEETLWVECPDGSVRKIKIHVQVAAIAVEEIRPDGTHIDLTAEHSEAVREFVGLNHSWEEKP